MKTLNSGDLVYLPANFILTKHNNDGTVSQYCELKHPCVCILLRSDEACSELFYRGQTCSAPNHVLTPYKDRREGEKDASYTS